MKKWIVEPIESENYANRSLREHAIFWIAILIGLLMEGTR